MAAALGEHRRQDFVGAIDRAEKISAHDFFDGLEMRCDAPLMRTCWLTNSIYEFPTPPHLQRHAGFERALELRIAKPKPRFFSGDRNNALPREEHLRHIAEDYFER